MRFLIWLFLTFSNTKMLAYIVKCTIEEYRITRDERDFWRETAFRCMNDGRQL
jgi:hypothetical protein